MFWYFSLKLAPKKFYSVSINPPVRRTGFFDSKGSSAETKHNA